MKFIFAFSILIITFSCCGLLEATLPLEWPQRYIEREVESDELVGVWELTSNSEREIKNYYSQRNEAVELSSPWKTIVLNQDGSCSVEFVLDWNSWEILEYASTLETCTWKKEQLLGYNERGLSMDVLGVRFGFEYHDPITGANRGIVPQLYIYEDDGELILWDFYGVPEHNYSF